MRDWEYGFAVWEVRGRGMSGWRDVKVVQKSCVQFQELLICYIRMFWKEAFGRRVAIDCYL